MIPFSVKNVREPIEYDTYWGVPNEYRGKSWWNEQQTLESCDVYYPWRCKIIGMTHICCLKLNQVTV